MSETPTVVVNALFSLYAVLSLVCIVRSTAAYVSSLCARLHSRKPARRSAATPTHPFPTFSAAPTFGGLLDVTRLLSALDSSALSRLAAVIGNRLDSPPFLFFCGLLVGISLRSTVDVSPDPASG
ncbi:hypothetical protein C8Q80DRAFT_1270082 [Daedaleopsis nitida]|nr:hypothetical protein C8Q80DRAFT_1270082 [Daedaleopsis nitida]